jgi:catechol 2,3-dioxygenase-like lactoylglutathione lyase family enzyme
MRAAELRNFLISRLPDSHHPSRMPRILDHIDLRVPDVERARAFYDRFLAALGYGGRRNLGSGWNSYNAPGEPSEFFGFVESPNHVANENRIAFRAESNAAVDAFIPLLREIGAQNIEGPNYDEGAGYYYAVFFEDPFGNRLEICHRTRN